MYDLDGWRSQNKYFRITCYSYCKVKKAKIKIKVLFYSKRTSKLLTTATFPIYGDRSQNNAEIFLVRQRRVRILISSVPKHDSALYTAN